METNSINKLIQRAIVKIKLPFQSVIKASKVSGTAFLYSLKNGLSAQDREEIENLQHYGFISRMPAGTRVITIPRGGKTENLVIVSEEHKTAISLAESDVVIERDTGEYIWVKAGEIEINANQVVVNCTDSTVNCSGNAVINAGGDVSATASGNVNVEGTNITATATAQASVTAPIVDVTAATSATVAAPTINVTATVLATVTALTLNVVSAVQVTVTSASILLGAVAGCKALITEAAMSILNGHTHQDSMGGTTGTPSAIIGASETTTITKAL